MTQVFTNNICIFAKPQYNTKMQIVQTRRKAIMQILQEQRIYNQEQLQEQLLAKGIESTQATLSRDLRALNVSKINGEGYKIHNGNGTLGQHPLPGSVTIEFSGQLAVIKAQLGFAPAIAASIDAHSFPSIIGTLAGDDTVLLILRQGYTPGQITSSLQAIFHTLRKI